MTALAAGGMPVIRATALVGYPRASYYRHTKAPSIGPRRPVILQADRFQPSALDEDERAAILAVLNSPEYESLSLSQTYHRAWDASIYLASLSTWYRVGRDAGQVKDRRRQATSNPKKIPELVANAPSQVWSWDITKLRGPRIGTYFHFYVITDIYSRKIVGWRVEDREVSELAKQMIQDAVIANGKAPRTLHSDNGSAMISGTVGTLLEKLGVGKSFSRPKVSNDNPFSEALFRTCKYVPEFPGIFESLEAARAYAAWFVHEYNMNHRHSGIGWHTPNNVHNGTTTAVTAIRRAAIDKVWHARPERYTNRPKPPRLPGRAHINKPLNQNPPTLSHAA